MKLLSICCVASEYVLYLSWNLSLFSLKLQEVEAWFIPTVLIEQTSPDNPRILLASFRCSCMQPLAKWMGHHNEGPLKGEEMIQRKGRELLKCLPQQSRLL